MELQDNAIIYSTYYQDVKKQIEKLKSINIDTTKLEKELNDINKETENDISKTDITLNNFGIEVYYQNGINKLKKLLSTINNYSFYFQMNNLIKLLKLKLRDINNISTEELDIYIDDIENYLTQIKHSSTIDYKDEESIIDELYKLAYTLIKQEIILKGNSSLLEYINKSKIDLQKIDKIIHKEIEQIDLNKNIEIAVRVYELDSEGIDSTYVDLELLKLLSNHNERSNFINTVKQTLNQEELEKTISEYKENINEITSTENNHKNIYSEIQKLKTQIKKAKKTIAFSIISGILSLATIISFGAWRIPQVAKEKRVKTTTYTYTDSNEIPEETSDYLPINDSKKVVIYQEFSPYTQNGWNKDSLEREIKTYDISDIELSNNLDYLELDLEKLNRTPEITTEEKEQLVPEDLYEDTIRKLTIQIQDLEDYIFELDQASVADAVIAYLGLNILLQSLLSIPSWNITLIMNVLYIIDSLNDINSDKYEIKYKEKRYQGLIGELKKLINNNIELRNKFNEIYNQNINYYSKIEEIKEFYNEINNINEEEYIELLDDILKPKKKEKVRVHKKR